MRWLDLRPTQRVDYAWLRRFEYDGVNIPLMDRQRGIRKPAGMAAALAIRTTFTPPNQLPPYRHQGVHNSSLAVIPSTRAAQPSKERLEERYADFLAAG